MSSCPRCGAPLPADRSPCPRCLMELGQSVDPRAETTALPPEEPAGELGSIGPYRLLAVLGEGGMGTVYLAEQRQPIQRRVALKLVRAGLAGKEALARFEAERQALALMTHPGIARVLDAGTTAEGAPYFVMEYVHGEPINAYCDKKRLSTAERIDLFRAVCAAVQHAHQRGILHRDLKPSNILVEEVDGEPRPRIIDFGLAKALNQRLTERTLFTERGAIVGTPEYMSPEQAAGEAFDVDTTTDVYSLGVVLYELLTGTLPHDPERLREAGWLGMMKLLREEEPKRPSTQVSTFNDETASAVASKRKTEPRTLRRSLTGDLDWIVLKALDKERERRYPNVSDLAADLERHLANEPVTAGPPSAWYRARKFVARNRWGVSAVLAVILLLAAGLVAVSGALARESSARSLAESHFEAQRILSDFYASLLGAAAAQAASGKSVSLAVAARSAVESFERHHLRSDPLAAAQAQLGMSELLHRLDLEGEAISTLRSALETQRALLPADSIDIARTEYLLGTVLQNATCCSDDENEREGSRLLAHSLRVFDATRPQSRETADALCALVMSDSPPELAPPRDQSAERCLELTRAAWGEQSPRYVRLLILFGASGTLLGETPVERETARGRLLRAEQLADVFHGREQWRTAQVQLFLAFTEESERQKQRLRTSVDLFTQTLGAGDVETALAELALGAALNLPEPSQEGMALRRGAIKKLEKVWGADEVREWTPEGTGTYFHVGMREESLSQEYALAAFELVTRGGAAP